MLQVAAAKSHGHCSFLLNFHAEDATYIYIYIRCTSATGEWVEYDGIVTVSGLQDTTLQKTHEYV